MYQFYQNKMKRPAIAIHEIVVQFFFKPSSNKPGIFSFTALLTSFGLLFSSLVFAGADPHPDYAPLFDFYTSTNGPGWNYSNKWLTDNNPCGWYGVGCTDNRVTTISLMSNNVVGSIPASLGNLTNLKILELRDNGLTGSIPAEIGNLTKLEEIYLIGNQLSGSIPSSIGNLVNLKNLLLRKNQLSGEIPSSLGKLSKLALLNLGVNRLSGPIPGSLGDISTLTAIDLEINELTGTIPDNLANLSKLNTLTLGTNKLSGNIPEFIGGLTTLDALTLENNGFSGPIPSNLGNLTKLSRLLLTSNQLSGSIPGSLGNLTGLFMLSLGSNRLTGTIPDSFGNFYRLFTLDLNGNQLSGSIPSSLGNLYMLEYLFLGNNQLSGSIPNELGNLRYLKILSLIYNNLTGEIPASLGNLLNVRELIFRGNKLSGPIPASLGNLTKLEQLSIHGNKISGEIPASLGNITSLQYLYLQENQLSGAIPSSLGHLPNLKLLWLNSNQLSGCYPESLRSLCNISVQFQNNPGLPGGGNFTNFCSLRPGSNGIAEPTIALSSGISQPILQNTASVSLIVSGCEGGSVTWWASNNTRGSGYTITVPTTVTGTLIYTAVCNVGSCTSLPGTASVVISAAPTTGNFDGFVYGADCETFRGWAWDRDKVNTVISVTILDGANVIATLPAGDFRQDLLNAGKGNGKHAFSFPIPANLKDGRPHQLTARVAGSNFLLKNPPKALTCQGSGGPVNLPPVAPTTIPGNITTSTNYFYSLNLPAFIDPENGALSYELTGLPNGLSFTPSTRLISGMSTTGGSFTLTYSATDNQGAKSQVTIEMVLIPAPAINQPPVAPATSPLSTTIGTPFSVNLPAFTDPEIQTLTYSLSGLPTGLGFTSSTRLISGTAGSNTVGSYVLTYSASDGTNTTPTSVTLTVVPGSTTPPPVVTGDFDGYLSVVNCQEMRGWVWDRNKPNTPLMVEFFANGSSIGTVEAKNFRQDLKDAQKGNGNHGYTFSTPVSIKDNVTRQISAKVQNSTYTLKGSPVAFKCAPSGRLSAESEENRLSVVILGNPSNRDAVEVEIRGAEGQPLRLQLTDTGGRLVSEHQVEKPAEVEHQILPLVNQAPGLLFLRAQSGLRSVTLKVLKQ